jgi:hypothetical protein
LNIPIAEDENISGMVLEASLKKSGHEVAAEESACCRLKFANGSAADPGHGL